MTTHAGIRVPQISREELFAFHESHFSHVSVVNFGTTFTSLPEPTTEENEDYKVVDIDVELLPEDGEGDDDYDPETSFDLYAELPDIPAPFVDNEAADEREIVEAADGGQGPGAKREKDEPEEQPRKKRRRKKNNTGNSNARRYDDKKPDLRKRTWDVVDSGLGSLDYDGTEQSASSMQAAPARRRVQYDDD
ncbi:Casein kinase II subunit alpha' [Sporothrix eucalyptigena]|uniref:Casein kinase II subunit alpha n=1 Tax=Sporothrix eucalyptigena TaxID=1812306 RepID=A0ABP0AMV9_9PEZI